MLSPTIPVAIGSTSPSTSTTSTALTLTAAVAVGEFVIAGFGIGQVSTTVSSISDTKGNTYQVDISNGASGARTIFNISSKITTPLVIGDVITVNFTGVASANRRAFAYKTTQLDPTAWKQASAGATSTSTTASSGNIVVTGASVLIFGFAQYNALGSTYTPGAGYTILDNIQGGAQNWVATEYKIITPGTYVADGTVTNVQWHQNGVAYVGAPSGGGNLMMMGCG